MRFDSLIDSAPRNERTIFFPFRLEGNGMEHVDRASVTESVQKKQTVKLQYLAQFLKLDKKSST